MKRKQGTESTSDNSSPMAITVYLIIYNILQCTGWTVIGTLLALHLVTSGTHRGMYESVSLLLKIFQFAAILEVAHAAFGMVRSSVMTTAAQVFSRVYCVFLLISIPQVQDSIGVPLLLFAWTITEIIRYCFYTLSILGNLPYMVQWLRYSLFIVLYPIGVTGELLVLYGSLWYSDQVSWSCLRLPNAANISFSLAYLTAFNMLMYIPGFPQLYTYMLRQRRKVIGGMRTKVD